MSMRKKAVSLLLCAALALSLAACGTRPETPAQPAASPATAAPLESGHAVYDTALTRFAE